MFKSESILRVVPVLGGHLEVLGYLGVDSVVHVLVYFGFVHTVSAVNHGSGGEGEENKDDDEIQFRGCPLMNIHILLILVISLLDMVIVDDTALDGIFLAPLLLVLLHDLFFLVRDAVGLALVGSEARLDL